MSLRGTLRSPRERPHLPHATGSDFESIRKEVNADLAVGATTVVVTGARRSGKTPFCEIVARFADPRSFPLVIATAPDNFDALAADVLRRCGVLHDIGQSNQQLSHETLVAVLERLLTSISSLQGKVVLIFDDAHQLKAQLVEQVQQLTVFRPKGRGVLQVLLVGEPSLIDLLGADSLRNSRLFISRRHQLPLVAPTATNGAEASQRVRRALPNLWLASTVSAALAIVALTVTWVSHYDVVPPAKAANVFEQRTPAGYIPSAIPSATVDGLASRQSTDPPGQADNRHVPAARVPPKPTAAVVQPVPLADVLRQAAALSKEPNVKALVRLREEVAARVTQSTGIAERDAIAQVIKALDRTLDEARQRQLEVDGQRLAGKDEVRSGTELRSSR